MIYISSRFCSNDAVPAVFLQTPHNVEIPGAIKDFLAGAGVLDAVPWDGQPAVTRTTDIPYCQPPADQSYDWDYSSDSLTDAIQGETPDHALEQVHQVWM